MEHYASGYAKIMCSSVFITGLDPAFAAENVGYFTAPYAERARLGTPKIDREKRRVQVTMPNGKVRTAKQVASQGCDAADRPNRCVLQAVDCEERAAGSKDTAVADGRRTSLRDSAAGSQPGQDSAGGRCGLRPRGHDRGVRGHVQRADQRRALRREHHTHDAARGLVDGEEHERNAYGHPHQQSAYELWQPAPIPEWQNP